MRLLLDEDVPAPLTELLRHILAGHHVDHVYSIRWGGKTDVHLYRDAGRRHYDAILTNNVRQLQNPDECDAIKRSGVHPIFYEVESGVQGLAMASGAICAALRPALEELAKRSQQHIVRVTSLSATKGRFTISDPATDPPSPYWS